MKKINILLVVMILLLLSSCNISNPYIIPYKNCLIEKCPESYHCCFSCFPSSCIKNEPSNFVILNESKTYTFYVNETVIMIVPTRAYYSKKEHGVE